jgi:hypothetical protein
VLGLWQTAGSHERCFAGGRTERGETSSSYEHAHAVVRGARSVCGLLKAGLQNLERISSSSPAMDTARCLPGTSSVKRSLNIPRFDFRGDGPASFSLAVVAVGAFPESSVGFRGFHLPRIAIPGELGFETVAEAAVSACLWIRE